MESLQALFGEGKRGDIHRLARLIQQHVDQQWQNVFRNTQEEMAERYAEIGDGVYGIYGTQLFRPVLDALKAAGLRSKPRLPYGNFTISREWGPEDDRQRWFWSKITSADGAALGTIAIVFYHDHIQLRIPRPMQVIALDATSKSAVIAELSRRSADFRDALDMKAEIALYMQQQATVTE